MKTAIYARRSTSKLGQNETIENQIKICRNRAVDLGLEIVDIKTDTGKGSDDLNRPEVRELIRDAINGKYECVILKGISRLYRDTEKGLGLVKKLDRSGIRVLTVEEDFDSFRDRAGNTIDTSRITMYLMFAEYEVKKLADRVKHTQLVKAQAGEWNQANSTPIGYSYNPETKKLKIDYTTMPLVKLIYELYLNGMGMKNIAHYLNGDNPDGKVYETVKKKRWNEYTVGYILKNQVYCGDVVYNRRSKKSRPYKNPEMLGKTEDDVYTGNDYNDKKEWIITKDAHEPIIGRDTFDKVQNIMGTKAKRKGVRNNTSLLAGILKCGKCMSGMTFKSGRKNDKGWIVTKDNYYCLNYIRYGKKFCTSHHIGAEKVENLVYEYLKNDMISILDMNSVVKTQDGKGNGGSKLQRDVAKIENGINAVTAKMDNLLTKNTEGDISDAQFKMMNNKYVIELESLTNQLAELKVKLSNEEEEGSREKIIEESYNDILNFENLTKEEQRYLIHRLVDSVILKEDEIIVNVNY